MLGPGARSLIGRIEGRFIWHAGIDRIHTLQETVKTMPTKKLLSLLRLRNTLFIGTAMVMLAFKLFGT